MALPSIMFWFPPFAYLQSPPFQTFLPSYLLPIRVILNSENHILPEQKLSIADNPVFLSRQDIDECKMTSQQQMPAK
jgi:hypothetical protein